VDTSRLLALLFYCHTAPPEIYIVAISGSRYRPVVDSCVEDRFNKSQGISFNELSDNRLPKYESGLERQKNTRDNGLRVGQNQNSEGTGNKCYRCANYGTVLFTVSAL